MDLRVCGTKLGGLQMKLFDNAAKSEEKQKELEAEQLRAELENEKLELEKERQAKLESKLDELILVGKAVYTILRQEHEERQAAYERLESRLQAATSELISTQEKAVKVMIAYGREDNQKAIDAINEEVVKVQSVTEAAQKQLLGAVEELNSSIKDNTFVLGGKLGELKESIKDINISVEAAPVSSMLAEEEASEYEEVPVYEPEEEIVEYEVPAYEPELIVETEPDSIFMPEMEEEVPVEEDIMSVLELEQEESLEEELVIPEIEFEDVPDTLEDTIPEEVFAMLEEVEEDVMEEILIPEDIFEEALELEEEAPEDIFAVFDEEEVTFEEELVIPEPIVEAEPILEMEPVVAAPVVDDPNRAMTPDEIAALIASVNGGSSEAKEEPAPIPEPEPEPTPVTAPVVDDPNRAMTPDEIAALIASMS